MDETWDLNLWEPTQPRIADIGETFEIFDNAVHARTEKELQSLRSRLIATTKNIKENPYAFRFWTKRSKNLLDLGYPELAAGDSYKALLLCESALVKDDPLGKKVWQTNEREYVAYRKPNDAMDENKLRQAIESRVSHGRQAAFHELIVALMTLRALPDALFIIKRATRLYPSDKRFASLYETVFEKFQDDAKVHEDLQDSFEVQKRGLSFGTADMRVYPWEPARFRIRQDADIEAANSSLKACSRNLQVRRSTIMRSQGISQAHPDCYGLFATRHIRPGNRVLKESHIVALSLEQGREACYNCFMELSTCDSLTSSKFKCCGMPFCSQKCKNVAKSFYHEPICGRDFTAVLRAADVAYGGKNEGADAVGSCKTELQGLTGWNDTPSVDLYGKTQFRFPDHIPVYMIRIIASCLQAGYENPLEYPIVAQLSSKGQCNVQWNLNGMISGPIRVLRTFGVNVFEDHNWDTWVVVSMWNRITSNSGSISSVSFPNYVFSPLYFWFNHSCDPNTTSKQTCGAEFEVFATKDIYPGEEVFVSILGPDIMKQKKRDRQAKLANWMRGVTCQCFRCLTEFG